jgi:hypothetical protein
MHFIVAKGAFIAVAILPADDSSSVHSVMLPFSFVDA